MKGAERAAAAAAAAWCDPWWLWRCEGWEDNTLFACCTNNAVLQDCGLMEGHLLLFVRESSDNLPIIHKKLKYVLFCCKNVIYNWFYCFVVYGLNKNKTCFFFNDKIFFATIRFKFIA